MKFYKFKSKALALFTVMIIVLQSLTPVYAAGKSAQENHTLPVLKVLPTDGSTFVRPDTQIKIYLDPNADTFNRFRQQFEKGSYSVYINGNSCTSSYDSSDKVITVQNDVLDRYTNYEVNLLVKAKNKSDNTNSGNASYSFSFSTGSALHEATSLNAEVLNNPVRVTEKAEVAVKLADDYGLPADNATVTVSHDVGTVDAETINITSESNGKCIIQVTNQVKGPVHLTVSAQDNTHSDLQNRQSVDCKINFIAGLPDHIFTSFSPYQIIGTTDTINGAVYDIYNNFVEDDSIITVEALDGTISPQSMNTIGGMFSFAFTAPNKIQDVTIKASSGSATNEFIVHITSNSPASLVFDNEQYEFEPSEGGQIAFTVYDIQGNPVANTVCTVSSTGTVSLPESAITDENGRAVINIISDEEEELTLSVETLNGVKNTVRISLLQAGVEPPDEAPVVTISKENGNIMLKWAPIDNAVYYTVNRRVAGEDYTEYANYLSDAFFADGDITSGKTYSYTVTASNAGGTSPVSTEVTIDYTMPMNNLGTLSASQTAVYTGEDQPVVFRITAPGKLANDAGIELVLVDENGNKSQTVALMQDDGNVNNGDDISDDGVYSTKVILHENSEKALQYKAYAQVEIDNSVVELYSANIATVDVLSHFTGEQISSTQSINTQAVTLLTETLTAKDEAAAAQEVIAWLKNNANVTDAGFSTDSNTVWYTLNSGIKGVIPIAPPGTNGSLSSLTMNYNYSGSKATYPLYSAISQSLSMNGYNAKVIEDSGLTLDMFKNLSAYKVIIINSHGNLYQDKPYILSAEPVNATTLSKYENDLKAGRIIVVATTAGNFFGVMPDFIKEYTKLLPDSIIFLASCQGLQNTEMWDTFKKLGAKTIFGFKGDVFADYAAEVSRVVFSGMINDRLTAGQAYDWTVEQLGDADNAWRLAKYQEALTQTDDPAKKQEIEQKINALNLKQPAFFKMYGEREVSLINEEPIVNGSFENDFDGWLYSGDARVITQLGPLQPTDGGKMAIISTGLGSVNQSNSTIQQTFYVPAGCSKLTFDYNVVSEEPMEYVGSQYDDKFQCTIQLLSETKIIAQESVNASTWLPVDGINFDGGDATTFMTGWKNIVFDVSSYQDQYVTLKFHVWDVGDSIYDTAALIDNIKRDFAPTEVGLEKNQLIWPIESTEITLPFGAIDELYNKKHVGLDIQCNSEQDVFAAADGEVVFAGFKEGYGNVVYINSIQDNTPIQTRYAHLSSIDVAVGNTVQAGEVIGISGSTGDVVGDNVLHFEVLVSTDGNGCLSDGSNAVNVNPQLYLFPILPSDFSYLSQPFSLGTVSGDEFGTMGTPTLTADQRYTLNLDLKTGESYLRKLVKAFSLEETALIWDSQLNAALVSLNGNKKYYGIDKKYGNARMVNNRLVVNVDEFISYFYPNLIKGTGYPGYVLSIDMKDTFNVYVLQLQKRLKALGYKGNANSELNPNGYFDENTMAAVNIFKAFHGLGNDGPYKGKVGAQTWGVLFSTKAKPYQPPAPPPVQGNEADIVRSVLIFVSSHEGGWGTAAVPADSSGLSYGIIQCNFKSGTLQPLLKEFDKYDATTKKGNLDKYLGKDKANLIRNNVLNKSTAEGTNWANQNLTQGKNSDGNYYGVKKEWKTLFNALGGDKQIQVLEVKQALNNYFKPILNCINIVGIEKTDRSVGVMFDTFVQGGSWSESTSKKYKQSLIDKGLPVTLINLVALRATKCKLIWQRNFAVRKLPTAAGHGYTTYVGPNPKSGADSGAIQYTPSKLIQEITVKSGTTKSTDTGGTYKNWSDNPSNLKGLFYDDKEIAEILNNYAGVREYLGNAIRQY